MSFNISKGMQIKEFLFNYQSLCDVYKKNIPKENIKSAIYFNSIDFEAILDAYNQCMNACFFYLICYVNFKLLTLNMLFKNIKCTL